MSANAFEFDVCHDNVEREVQRKEEEKTGRKFWEWIDDDRKDVSGGGGHPVSVSIEIKVTSVWMSMSIRNAYKYINEWMWCTAIKYEKNYLRTFDVER